MASNFICITLVPTLTQCKTLISILSRVYATFDYNAQKFSKSQSYLIMQNQTPIMSTKLHLGKLNPYFQQRMVEFIPREL